jgi:hypothetical protein
MQIGQHIEIPGIRGAADLVYDLPDFTAPRQVKVYLVPEAVSADRYFVSITMPGATPVVPPSRAKDTLLLVGFHQETEAEARVVFVHDEVKNA